MLLSRIDFNGGTSPLKVSSQISELWPFRFPPPAPVASTSAPALATAGQDLGSDAISPTTQLSTKSVEGPAETESGPESDARERQRSETPAPTTPLEGVGKGGDFKDKFRDSLRKRG